MYKKTAKSISCAEGISIYNQGNSDLTVGPCLALPYSAEVFDEHGKNVAASTVPKGTYINKCLVSNLWYI